MNTLFMLILVGAEKITQITKKMIKNGPFVDR